MATEKSPEVTEKESLKVAEASRQTEWEQPSFMREFFLGQLPPATSIHPFPLPGTERPEFTAFYARFRDFLQRRGRPRRDRRAPASTRRAVLDGLRRLGRLRDEDPDEVRRARLHERRVQPRDGAARQLLTATSRRCSPRTSRSACPQPLKTFGTEELKKKYLPRCAAGEISAFALTEPRVGSDPARMLDDRGEDAPTAPPTSLNGTKLWTHERHDREAARGDGGRPETRRRSARSWSRPTGRASRSSTAAASWA